MICGGMGPLSVDTIITILQHNNGKIILTRSSALAGMAASALTVQMLPVLSASANFQTFFGVNP
jgi:hypothetical protein